MGTRQAFGSDERCAGQAGVQAGDAKGRHRPIEEEIASRNSNEAEQKADEVMDWIVTTARTVDEAQTRALDLLGVDSADAEIQVIEEGKTGLFGRTKTEARVRARIKPKAPPAKEERRQGRNDRGRGRGNNRGNNRSGGEGRNDNRGGNRGGNKNNDGGGNRGNRSKNGGNKGSNSGNRGNKSNDGASKNNDGANKRNRGAAAAGAAGGAAAAAGGSRRNDGGNRGNRGGNRQGGGDRNRRPRDGGPQGEDRIEMPIDEQKETLVAFVRGVATSFDASSTVNLVEEGTTLRAEVQGDELGLLIGNRASTLGTLEELSRTAMHRAAAGRRYHRIQVDVDGYKARRREALAKFAVQVAESVADSGESKALEPMNAADRKLVHDAVGEVDGVETISEGRDPRRHIVIRPLDGAIVDEEE